MINYILIDNFNILSISFNKLFKKSGILKVFLILFFN